MQKKSFLSTAAIAAFVLGGCTGNGGYINQQTAIGAAIGTVAGGVIGHQIDGDHGRYYGAVAGALAGGAIGNYMNKQQQQIQRQVQGTGINVNRVDDATLQLNIPSEVLFAVDQSTIKPQFYPALDSIAQTLQQYPSTIVHVYGFTDGSGSAQHNMRLSQQRAQNAAQYLISRGVNPQRFVVRGYGEQMARAEHNQQDRRVEVFIRAINDAAPQAAYQQIY